MARPPRNALIPYAKISEAAARRIVQGFGCAESISEIASATGISEKTCRSIVLALRYRLDHERFRLWREPSAPFWLHQYEGDEVGWAAVMSLFAVCYFNRHCYSDYQQGRRANRVCRRCPIRALELDETDLTAMVKFTDIIEQFYFSLGIGGERKLGKLTLFHARFLHTQIVGQAWENTRKRKNGNPDFSDRRMATARQLYEALIHELEAEPLRDREPPPVSPELAPFVDLTWLDE